MRYHKTYHLLTLTCLQATGRAWRHQKVNKSTWSYIQRLQIALEGPGPGGEQYISWTGTGRTYFLLLVNKNVSSLTKLFFVGLSCACGVSWVAMNTDWLGLLAGWRTSSWTRVGGAWSNTWRKFVLCESLPSQTPCKSSSLMARTMIT